ncbi:MAG: ABC transporter permease subunit [Coprococcus sp.]|nr:ABC transporter permease subunit [Coprococcus sp.]
MRSLHCTRNITKRGTIVEKVQKVLKSYWLTVIVVIALLGLYIYVSENKLYSTMMFPEIDNIWETFLENRDVMFKNLLASIQLLIPSIFITLFVALTVGIILGTNKFLRKALHPIIYACSCVPSILISPFVLLVIGDFYKASIFLIFYGTIWATLFATITGIETIDKRYFDNAKTLELKGIKLMTKVVLPAASPNIIGGFVNSLRSSFVMLVFAEMYGASYGLGFYVKRYCEYGLYPNVWAGFIFMVLILVITMQFFEKLKQYLLKWTV